MSSIEIRRVDLTRLPTEAIVNAANTRLQEEGGVSGCIFRAAREKEMAAACYRIGHCDSGNALITPGFALHAKYVIHAVGPIWSDGTRGEPETLANAYRNALTLAKENGIRSIGFPLISTDTTAIRWSWHGMLPSERVATSFGKMPTAGWRSHLPYWTKACWNTARRRCLRTSKGARR